MRRLLLPALFCVLGSLWAARAPAADRPADVERVLSRLEASASRVRTLTADFVQEKHLSMFQEVISSRGRLSLEKPDRLRWELTEPVGSWFSIKGKDVRRWHELTGRLESFEIGKEPVLKVVAEQLFAWVKADFGRLLKDYRVTVLTEEPVSLLLEPASSAWGSYLDRILITFAADGSHVQKAEIREKGGDYTVITFTGATVNGTLPADLF